MDHALCRGNRSRSSTNTIQHLIEDIEQLRISLGIDRWLVWGGSWGSTLGLAYAEAHPEAVTELIPSIVCSTNSADIEWATRTMGRIFPERWHAFVNHLSSDKRWGNLATGISDLLMDPDPRVHEPAALAWCDWEDTHMSLVEGYQPGLIDEDPAFRLCYFRLVTHYWANAAFLEDDQLLRNAPRLAGVPTFLSHGRLDVSSPMDFPVALARAIPGAELFVADRDGHGGPAMIHLQWHSAQEWSDGVDGNVYRFLVDDPDALRTEISEQSNLLEDRAVADTAWGTREFGPYDPDGNALFFYRDLKAGTAEDVPRGTGPHSPSLQESLQMNSDLDALATVTAYLSDRLGTIADEQWVLPTPCADWDLRDLVDHVAGGNWFTLAVLAGATADDALAEAMQQFAGGSPTAQQATESASEQLGAFRTPNVLLRTWQHVAGDLTGSEILRLRLHDLIVHAWDIDQSLEPPAELPEELALWGLAELGSANSLAAKHFGIDGARHGEIDRPTAAYLDAFGRAPGPRDGPRRQ